MIVHIRWNLAKELIAEIEANHSRLPAIKRIRAGHGLRLKAAKEVVDALTNGNFTMENYRSDFLAETVVQVEDDKISLTIDNCPKLNT